MTKDATPMLNGNTHTDNELRAVMDTVLDGLITIDGRGVIRSYNAAAVRIFGYEPEEVIGQNVRMLMPEPYHAEHDDYIKNYLETGDRKVIGIGREVAAKRKDGSVFPMELGINEMNIGGERMFVGTIRDITERKDAQRRAAEEAERLRTVMDTVLDGLMTIDSRGVIQSFNAAAVRIFGYQPSEVIGHNVRMLMPEPYHAGHDSYIRNYLETGEKKVIGIGREVTAKRKDGSIFPMELGINEMSAGGERMFVGTIRDITERKVAQRRAAEEAERLRTVMDTVLDGLITIDGNGVIQSFNAAAVRIFGYEPEEVVGQNVRMLMPEPYHAEHDGYIKNYMSTGDKKVIGIGREVTAKRKDGTIFPMELGINEMQLNGARMFVGTIRDIAERNRVAEKVLLLASVVESTEDAVLTKTLDGVITSWNRGAERLLGYTAQEAIGQSMSLIIPHNRMEEENAITDRIRNGEIVENLETERRHKDGGLIAISVTICPMRNVAGEVIGASKIARDITARKQMDRMKDEFVSTVNHELRTPLSSIYGSIRLLHDLASTKLDAKSGRLLELAQQNCARLTRIVDDILDLEKIMAGKMEYFLEEVEAAPLIKDIVDRHLGMAERYGVVFDADIDVPGLFINVDPDRFNQALVNLLSNAAKYSPKGDAVRIVARREGGAIRVSVADNGPGIPDAFRSKIFERFARADGSNTRKVGGSGLGLNITKTLIEAFGGSVSFDTAEGKGTTFYIMLPISKEDAESPNTLKRILYLEDDESIAELAMIALEDIGGFEVRHCSTGREAIAAMETFKPHLLLFDVMLPDMDGPQTLNRIKTLYEIRNTPAIFMTAKAQLHEQRSYLDLGACGVIVKPFDPSNLGERLRTMWTDYMDATRNGGAAPPNALPC